MTAETKEKQVLLVIENVRIKEYDSMNVIIERHEQVYNPIKKENNTKWRFKGYSSTILNALEFIARNELLIGKGAISNLESYLNQINKSNESLLKALGEVK